VTMANQEEAFGVTKEFLDVELSNLLDNCKLNCKIDKVSGII
jgi:hypothetical protein